ncbi:Hsp20/alpha crystallin family protein [Myxococcota bacterium]|nr:Hsp20/alpha crystallin family protein [Myxococcota bacterium]
MNETTNQVKDLELKEKRELKREEGTRQGPYFEPQVDIYETPTALTLVADLPGARSEDLEIDLRDSVLTLTAKAKGAEPRWRPVYEEYRVGHYSRQFRVGNQIDQAKISAKVKDGVLTLTLPKVDAVQPRKIKVETLS